MRIKLGQIFYGMGSQGYAVLACSPGAAGFEKASAGLCGMIGTPQLSTISPFVLASRPIGDAVLCARASQGQDDPNGRRTLLFHILVAQKVALKEGEIDAFSLAEVGAFSSSVPRGLLPDLEIAIPPTMAHFTSKAPFEVVFPAVLRLAKANDVLVRSILGKEVNRKTWTTLSEFAQERFDLCCVDMYAALPSGRRVYGENGLIRDAMQGTSKPQVTSSASTVERPRNSRWSAGFAISLLLNCIFALGIFFLVSQGKDRKAPRKDVCESLDNERQAFIEKTALLEKELSAVGEKMKELDAIMSQLSEDSVFHDWPGVVSKVKHLDTMRTPYAGREDQRAVFDKIEANVLFVHHLFDAYTKKGEDNK